MQTDMQVKKALEELWSKGSALARSNAITTVRATGLDSVDYLLAASQSDDAAMCCWAACCLTQTRAWHIRDGLLAAQREGLEAAQMLEESAVALVTPP